MREQKEKADAVMDVISSAGTSLTFILRPFRRFEVPFQVEGVKFSVSMGKILL